MVPIVIVTISEHIGHQLVLGKVVDRDYIKEPGLHRSLLGDGLGTLVSALIGGPPKTTYGENIGVLAITRVYSVYVILGAAVIAILLSFFGKAMAVIATIPTAVLRRSFYPVIWDYCIKWTTHVSRCKSGLWQQPKLSYCFRYLSNWNRWSKACCYRISKH